MPLEFPKVGLALSGGGFRAAAFHLGVLKRLEELGVLPSVSVLSVVSGGAIVGALYAARCEEVGGRAGSYPVDKLIAELRPFLMRNLRGRAFFGTPWRTARTVLSFAIPGVQRAPLFESALESLFAGRTMSDVPSWLVINATNLRTGKAWKFTQDLMGDYVVGACESGRHVQLAQAVAASAAFPGLVDALSLRTQWSELDPARLRPPMWPVLSQEQRADADRWRQRHGESRERRARLSGALVPNHRAAIMPLVDGGIYDNDGLVSLRAACVTHAIVSSSATPGNDYRGGLPFVRELVRVAGVMHARLGGANRSLCWESTHAAHPETVAARLEELAMALSALSVVDAPPNAVQGIIDELRDLAAVGRPPRGWQYTSSAQIVLHRHDVVRDAFARLATNPLSIPLEDRGVEASILDELSRIRTDLDAFSAETIDLLIGQGYVMADAYVKVTMPELLPAAPTAPRSASAQPCLSAIKRANADVKGWQTRLRAEGKRRLPVGRCGTWGERWRIWAGFVGGLTVLAALVGGILLIGAIAARGAASSRIVRELRALPFVQRLPAPITAAGAPRTRVLANEP